jgi:hypothetical protein
MEKEALALVASFSAITTATTTDKRFFVKRKD